MNPLFDKLCFYNVWNQKLLMITDSFLFGKDYLITMPRINVYRFFCAGQLSVTGEQIQKNKEPSAPGRNSPPTRLLPPAYAPPLLSLQWNFTSPETCLNFVGICSTLFEKQLTITSNRVFTISIDYEVWRHQMPPVTVTTPALHVLLSTEHQPIFRM